MSLAERQEFSAAFFAQYQAVCQCKLQPMQVTKESRQQIVRGGKRKQYSTFGRQFFLSHEENQLCISFVVPHVKSLNAIFRRHKKRFVFRDEFHFYESRRRIVTLHKIQNGNRRISFNINRMNRQRISVNNHILHIIVRCLHSEIITKDNGYGIRFHRPSGLPTPEHPMRGIG
jgi:hypothetical protein